MTVPSEHARSFIVATPRWDRTRNGQSRAGGTPHTAARKGMSYPAARDSLRSLGDAPEHASSAPGTGHVPAPGATVPKQSPVLASRTAAGLTQLALAIRVGVDPATIGRIERGTHVPRLELALRLSDVLGQRVEDLWPPAAFQGDA